MPAELRADTIVKSVESLLAEKEAVAEKEKGLIKELNNVLGKMGYEVVPTRATNGTARRGRRGRPPGRPSGRRRGRPPGRPPGRRRGRPPLSAMPRRRGRPPKVATE